ncbi:MAG: carboxypeptidase-like regulatory domain-containing protein [Bacteroidia bacterium]
MKLGYIRLVLIVLGLFVGQNLFSQSGQIRGVVIDTKGEPIPGAAVYVPEAQTGAYANDEGIFAVAKLDVGQKLSGYQLYGGL